MPLPLAPIAVAGLAGLAGGAASVAAGRAMDWLLGNEVVETDNDGQPVNVTTIVEVNSPVTVDARAPVNAQNSAEFSINDPGLTQPIGNYAVRPSTLVTDSHRLATINGVNQLARTEHGRSALSQFAERAEPETVRADRSARQQMATPPTQQAIRRTRPTDRRVRRQAEVAERQLARTAKADRSRTSLQYHEWHHNCIGPETNYLVLQHSLFQGNSLGMRWALSPVGDDPVDGEPPYWAWVKHDDFRKVINLVKRYRRYWRGKNMPLLRAELGFPTVEQAIADSLSNDADYLALRTDLIATDDFVWP